MKIRTRCEHCGKMYNMSDEYIGQTAQCKVCGKYFLMTVVEEAPLPPPPAPPAMSPFQQNPAATQFPTQLPPQNPAATQYPGQFAPQNPAATQFPTQLPPQNPAATQYPGQFAPQNPAATQFPGYGAPQPNFGQAPPLYSQPFETSFQEQAPRFGAAPAAPSPIGAPQPGQSSPVATQTVVCPKCKYTAEIPPVSGNMRIRCQECGKNFVIKPQRKAGAPKKIAKSSAGGSKKSVLALLFIVLLLAAVVFVGPTLLPDLIPNLLPF